MHKIRNSIAYNNVRPTLDALFGEGNWEKESRPSITKPGATTTWIVVKNRP